MTRQRKLIYDIISCSREHLSADQVYFLAKKDMPSIAVGTVYRNLNLMAESGEVRRLTVPGSPDRFDRTKKAHDHLICAKCGRLEDIELPALAPMLRESVPGYASYELNINYICPDCAGEMKGAIK